MGNTVEIEPKVIVNNKYVFDKKYKYDIIYHKYDNNTEHIYIMINEKKCWGKYVISNDIILNNNYNETILIKMNKLIDNLKDGLITYSVLENTDNVLLKFKLNNFVSEKYTIDIHEREILHKVKNPYFTLSGGIPEYYYISDRDLLSGNFHFDAPIETTPSYDSIIF